MEKRFRVLVAFYGFVVLVMMASKKSEQERYSARQVSETKMAAWDKMAR
jgi:hypothetical protein